MSARSRWTSGVLRPRAYGDIKSKGGLETVLTASISGFGSSDSADSAATPP